MRDVSPNSCASDCKWRCACKDIITSITRTRLAVPGTRNFHSLSLHVLQPLGTHLSEKVFTSSSTRTSRLPTVSVLWHSPLLNMHHTLTDHTFRHSFSFVRVPVMSPNQLNFVNDLTLSSQGQHLSIPRFQWGQNGSLHRSVESSCFTEGTSPTSSVPVVRLTHQHYDALRRVRSSAQSPADRVVRLCVVGQAASWFSSTACSSSDNARDQMQGHTSASLSLRTMQVVLASVSANRWCTFRDRSWMLWLHSSLRSLLGSSCRSPRYSFRDGAHDHEGTLFR